MRPLWLGLLVSISLHADIETVSASALDASFSVATPAGYSTNTQLEPFNTSLGMLDSVDLTITAEFQQALHYGALSYPGTPFPGSISYTTSGTSSFFGTQTDSQTVNVYIQGQSCLAPYCTFIATLKFGGEETFTDSTDLAAFETGNPVSLVASSAIDITSISQGVACCVTISGDGLTIPGPDPYDPIPVAGYLSLDVAAAYTYTPADPVGDAPEPQLTLAIGVGALSIAWLAARRRRIGKPGLKCNTSANRASAFRA